METEAALSSYHIFNAVAETGNISKAAKALYISQPAISRAVSRLEKNLSVKLFIRNSRGVRLTEEGELLYEHTRTAFDSLRQGEENLRRINRLGIGHLRIGVSSTLCKYVLMPYLKRFISAYPHIRITIQCHSTFETLSLLEDGKIDIGLVGEPSSLRLLSFQPVGNIEDTFVASRSYLDNLKLREQALTVDSVFRNGTLMLLDEKNMTRQYIDRFLTDFHIPIDQQLEVSNMDLLIDFARVGLGIACVIRQFVHSELADGTLIELPLPQKIPPRRIGFAFSKTTRQSDAVEKFIRFYQEDSSHEQ